MVQAVPRIAAPVAPPTMGREADAIRGPVVGNTTGQAGPRIEGPVDHAAKCPERRAITDLAGRLTMAPAAVVTLAPVVPATAAPAGRG